METTNAIKTIDAIWLKSVEDLGENHALVKFLARRAEGATYKQMPESILRLGYHTLSLFEQRQRVLAMGEVVNPATMSDTQFASWVRDQRLSYTGAQDIGNKTGLSWAEISVRCGVGEAVCRRYFTQAANADHKGLRIGHGGRFLEGQAAQYQDKAKKHGWIRPKGDADPVLAARLAEITGSTELAAEFNAMKVGELRAQLKELGQPTKGNKEALVIRLVTALAA